MARWIPDEQTAFARRLRREMTVAETMVWRALRGGRLTGTKFRRQVPVGPYVADFLCREAKLIVELDGAPHDDPERRAHDEERDVWLRAQGFHVLRFPNDLAVGGTEILVRRIEGFLKGRRRADGGRSARPPHPPPLRGGTFSRKGRRGVAPVPRVIPGRRSR